MQKIDDKILYFINEKLDFTWFKTIMKIGTFLGDFCLVWIIYCIFSFLRGDHSLTKQLILVMLLVNAINNGLIKALARRKRPFEDHPDIGIEIGDPYGSSFPSGHSANSFACAVVIFNYYPNFGFIAFILAGWIAISRMCLKVHYFSDVTVGSIVGVLTALSYLMWLN